MGGESSFMRFGASIVCLLAVAYATAQARREGASAGEWEPASEVSMARLRTHLETAKRIGSRLPGSEGERIFLEYAESTFRMLGFSHIRREPFEVTVPDPEAKGTLSDPNGAWRIEVFPLWPNLVRTSTCDVEGPLIYGARGTLRELSGKSLEGAIVLLEFDSDANWKNAMKLGAAAIVFIEPAEAERFEAEAKFSSVPLSAPRFWLPLRFAGPALAAAAAGKRAKLKCEQDWVVRTTYNLLADLPGTDPSLERERILVSAHADAMSVVPGLAPGAQEATGVAALLELASLTANKPGKRPLTFAVFGAQTLGLQGPREFVERRLEGSEEPLLLALSLDLSSGSPSLGAFAQGWFYEYRPEARDVMRSVARVLRSHAERFAPLVGASDPREVLADAVNESDGRPWKSGIPGKFALACEPFLQARYNAMTFATTDDARPHVDTPSNTSDRVNPVNLLRQTQTLAYLMERLRNDTTRKGVVSPYQVPLEVSTPRRMSLVGGFATLTGRVVEFDPLKSFVPDVAVRGALVASLHTHKTMMGVRGDIVQAALGRDARYRIVGAAPVSSWIQSEARPVELAAFALDSATGCISHAPSQGMMGDWFFDPRFVLKTAEKSTPLVVFRCVGTDLYDLTDPQDLKALGEYRVIDAATQSAPTYYGFFFAAKNPRVAGDVEDSAVIFTAPGSRWKLVMGTGLGDVRLALTNANRGDPSGRGYESESPGRGPSTALGQVPLSLLAARDMVALNRSRLVRFERYRIVAPGVRALHKESERLLAEALGALGERDWAAAERYARSAWGYALRAYPVLRGTASDAAHGVVFYLLLLVPFAYFLERLLFASRSLVRQLTVAVSLFFGAFALLRAVHPAFEIIANPSMVFVAFVMGFLSLLVMGFILGKFETSLKAMPSATKGPHQVDIGRFSVAMAAFNLGIGNMRRRRARTALTTLTLVVMTFIALSFSSVVTDLKFLDTPSDAEPTYPGLLVRSPGLEPLQPAAFRMLQEQFPSRAKRSEEGVLASRAVVRRVWFYGSDIAESSALSVRRAERVVNLRAVFGLDPSETNVTQPQRALVPGGRWFEDADERAVIVPRSVAEQLGIDPSEVGKAEVAFLGERYRVVAIAEDALLKRITDLDGDGVLPADFALSNRFQIETRSVADEFRRYLRLDPSVCLMLPANRALRLGGDIRSVAVSFASPEDSRAALEALIPRMRLNLYAAVPDSPSVAPAGAPSPMKVRMFGVRQGTRSEGLFLVLVQMSIASLFVLNTMVASVYERRREIGILSAIGLGPNHIAVLFFAEALVYGVLGAVVGYFLAQGVAKLILATGALPDLYLNFSSTSALLSACVVMAIVFLSTLFPARVAAKIAAPALDEGLWFGEPEGDRWCIPLPFNASREEAAGLVRFLQEWFSTYEEYVIGEFVTSETHLDDAALSVTTTVWPAPYDLGVAQRVECRAQETEIAGVYRLSLDLERLGGDPSNWILVNRRFLEHVRKQFLMWRTLDATARAAYVVGAPSHAS